VSPNGKQVYAVSEGDDAIVRFTRNPTTGALTFVESIVDGAGGVTGIAAANAVAVSPDGAYVYVVSGADTGAVSRSSHARPRAAPSPSSRPRRTGRTASAG